jgi:hypothetical protein
MLGIRFRRPRARTPEPAPAPTPAPEPTLPRDHYIPVRLRDLGPLLESDPGLTRVERATWTDLARLVEATFQHEFTQKRTDLIEQYTPIDPDIDWHELDGLTPRRTDGSFHRFLAGFESLLLAANYRRLDRAAIEAAIEEANETGVRYEPQLHLFDDLRVYVRGEAVIRREVRHLKNPLRKRVVLHPGFRRMVVAFKFRPEVDPGADLTRPDVLYLRLFKNVPRVDMEMHLPEQGTRVRMRWLDKAQIASPVAMGLPPLLVKLIGITSFLALPFGTLAGLLVAPFSLATKSFFGFQRAKSKHLHHMIRHLYYLNLANNRSVIESVADVAAEEEVKEVLLAYFVLWRQAPPVGSRAWTGDALDRAVEALLLQRTGLRLDFEIGDAVGKLLRLGLLRRDADALTVVDPREALRLLDSRWDAAFRHANPRDLGT